MTKVNPVPEQSTVRGCPESCFAMVQGKILKMKRGNFKKVFISSVLILLGFIFGLGISVFAWVNPSQSPPLGGGVLQTDNSGLKIVTTTQITTGNFTVNNGNVGIGTTAPGSLLEIRGTGGDTKGIRLISTGTNTPTTYIYPGASTPDAGFITFGDGTGWKFHIAKRSDAGATKFVTIQDNGNVGIGTTAPTARLHVFDSFRGNIKLLTTSGVGHDFGYDGGSDSAFWFTHTGAEAGYTLFRWDNGTSFRDLLYIRNSGNVGIGTTTPSQRLTVVGNIGIQAGANAFIGTLDNYALSLRTNNADRIFITNAGNVGIGTTTPATRLAVAGLTSSQPGITICSDTSGNFYYYAGSCVSSSIKYKTNIQNLGIGLETLLKLRPVTFEFKKDYGGYDGTIHMGFIAEEVEQVNPILVDYNNGEVSGVRYSELTALIVKSIQEQQNEIKDLKKEIEELKKMITR
jgi:hypothetical protein